jgi:hypothetical protein
MMMMSWTWIGMASLALAQEAPPTPQGRDIIVIGKRLDEARQRLADCMARRCPPDEEINASLMLAQEQFAKGDYQAAYSALIKSRSRNARYARQYPVSVANLYHAHSLVARNLGLADSERVSAAAAVGAMSAVLPKDDPRVLLERIELGDAYTRAGQLEDSRSEFERIAERAHAAGLPTIEGTALLRTAILYTKLAAAEPAAYGPDANRAINAILALEGPAYADTVKSARQLQVQLTGQAGRAADLDTVIASYEVLPPGTAPVLLYAPPLVVYTETGTENVSGYDAQTGHLADTVLYRLAKDDFDGQWVDVTFAIGRDGKVTNAHVAKHGAHLQGDWSDRLVAAVAQRRYQPQVEASEKTERYTFTSNWGLPTGSHIAARTAMPRLERVDLTN